MDTQQLVPGQQKIISEEGEPANFSKQPAPVNQFDNYPTVLDWRPPFLSVSDIAIPKHREAPLVLRSLKTLETKTPHKTA